MTNMSAESPSSPGSNAGDAVEKWACSICSSRKVKCDRRKPCKNCVQRGDECIYKAPPPPKRRKRKALDADLLEKIERHERLLNGLEISGESPSSDRASGQSISRYDPSSVATTSRSEDNPNPQRDSQKTLDDRVAIIVTQGKESRYMENNLWLALGDEIQNHDELLDRPQLDGNTTSALEHGSMIIGLATTNLVQPFNVWSRREETQVFLRAFIDNVDPLMKIVHIPTLITLDQNHFSKTRPEDPAVEALLISAYLAGVVSLSSAQPESTVGDNLVTHLQLHYFELCKQALVRAEFLKSSNIMVLQALLLYLVVESATQRVDVHSFYAMSGVAVRNAQRLGLHRDGLVLGLPPYEVELRRRLWWAVIFMDVRAAELSGAGVASVAEHRWDTKRPSNINDVDFDPAMKTMPVDRQGATDMTFVLMRCAVGEFLKGQKQIIPFGGSWETLASGNAPGVGKNLHIDQLESQLEGDFLRYCDPLNPIHTLAAITARGIITKMRIVASNPRQFIERGEEVPQAQRDFLFSNSLKILEYNNLGRKLPSLLRFHWHNKQYIQWHAIVFLLSELRYRMEGPEVEKAWEELNLIFEGHPEIIENRSNTLHRAIIHLYKRAWRARENRSSSRIASPQNRPRVVQMIFASDLTIAKAKPAIASQTKGSQPSHEFSPTLPGASLDVDESFTDLTSLSSESSPFDHLRIDWTDWDAIMREFGA